ncbi:MAG: aminotransferase class III-fold pyridoxal phosphate-dependent enzyme, partial [bacterium]
MDLNEEKQYLVPIYTRFPLVIERGEGVYVFDEDGNRYLDFASGIAVNSLGYSNPKVIEVAISQIKNLVH